MQQTSVQKTKKNQEKLGGMNMFKKMKHIKNEKGLTLIELLAVIVILAIIAAIAIPAIGNIISNTRDKAVLSEVQSAVAAAKIANADGSCTVAAATGDVTCAPGDYEFESDKFADVSATDTAPNIKVVFTKLGPVNIEATLANDFSGKKIPKEFTATEYATKVLKITESKLNGILD